MTVIFEMIFVDSKTKKRYKSPKHNNDEKLDDWHSTKRKKYKDVIMSKVEKKLKEQYGENADIVIVDGIIHLDPRIEKYKGKGTIDTGLKVDDHFDRIFSLLTQEVKALDDFKEINFNVSHFIYNNYDLDKENLDNLYINVICFCEVAA